MSQSVTKNADHHWKETTTINHTSGIGAGGSLAMQSGNDITFRGAKVSAGEDMAVLAGGNLTATTVTHTLKYDNVAADDRDKLVQHNYDKETKRTTFSAGGNATLAAVSTDKSKGNVTLTGSTLTAETGAANVLAAGNVTLNEGREEHDSYTERHSERGSFVKQTTTDEMQNAQTNLSVGSTVSGDAVNIRAGHDLTIKGATVAGTNDVNLTAANNVTIATTQDTQTSSSYFRQHESGIGTSGVGVSIGSKDQKDTYNNREVINNGSTIGSLNGNLNIQAVNDLHVTGSDLVAAKNVVGMGANVTIDAAADTAHHDEQHEILQHGFSIAVKAPVIDAVSNTVDQAHYAAKARMTVRRHYIASPRRVVRMTRHRRRVAR